MKSKIAETIDDNLDPEEVEKKMQIICLDPKNLTCDSYTQAMIEEDDSITSECFDGAHEEAHRAEES